MKRALALLALAAGCASSPRVDFGLRPNLVSFDATEYPSVRRRWTRHLHINHEYDGVLDAEATLRSPEFRAAYVAQVAAMRHFTPEQRDQLVEAERRAGEEAVEVDVMMQCSRWEWNDLGSPQSVWTITLTDDAHRAVAAVDVQAIRDKKEMLAALYPDTTSFTRAWRVRFPLKFPDGTPLLRPEAGELNVRFAGPLGSDEARWRSR